MKTAKNLLSILLIPLLLGGCLNYEQTTTLKIDGSGKMFIHYWTKWKTEKDSLLIENMGVFNKEGLTKELTASFTSITECEIYRDSADTTIHAKIEFEFTSVDSLNKMKFFNGANFTFKDGADNLKFFSQQVQPFATGFGIDRSKCNLTYTYYIPGDILQHNADELSNNKLTWNFNLDSVGTGKTLSATFRPFKLKETPTWIFATALGVLVVVFIFLFKKKKK